MKKILLLIFYSIFVLGIGAQGYVPKMGETIMFYPLKKEYKEKYMGYDCFYNAMDILPKNIKKFADDFFDGTFCVNQPVGYKFKEEYRYKINEYGLTPFEEIEGKTFKVIRSEPYMHKGKEKNKVFLLFLNRTDDDTKVVLRVPFFEDDASFLTKYLLSEIVKGFYPKTKYYYVNLPCIPVFYMDEIKDKYKGKELLCQEMDLINVNEQKVRNDVFKKINKRVNSISEKEEFFLEEIERCIDVRFEECDMSIYAQPFAICSYRHSMKRDTVRIPLTYIPGKTIYWNEYSTTNYLFENYFALKKDVINDIFIKEEFYDFVKKYTGTSIYFGLDEDFRYRSPVYGVSLNDGKTYKLKIGDVYQCLYFDVSWEYLKKRYSIYAILQDSLDTKFSLLVKDGYGGTKERFSTYFTPLEDALVTLGERKLLYDSWIKKYGTSYAEYLKRLDKRERGTFERMASMYGKATAKKIVEKYIEIGWTSVMCRVSLGTPDHINRTTNRWGTHEQWVYKDSRYKYLYFENDILTGIQE